MAVLGRRGWLTFVLLCLTMAIDRADQVLLPAVYLEICQAFGVGPAFLGTVTLCRGLAQSIFALASSPLADRIGRIRAVGAGCALWGLATAAVGLSPTVVSLLLARTVNGIGLGIVIPVVWAIVADLFEPLQRGRAFGCLFLAHNLGALVGGLVGTNLAGAAPLSGVAGWRLAFFLLAAISIVCGLLVVCVGMEPRKGMAAPPLTPAAAVAELVAVWRVRSFRVIILQGVPGTAPWYAISFVTLWLETYGFSHAVAARLRAAFDVGSTVGTLLGGALSDLAARVSPAHGRVAVAQLSVGSGIPLWLCILLVLPALHASHTWFATLLCISGLSITWCGAVNNAILAEVSPRGSRATVYGLDRALEGLMAPVSTALVGILAEDVFGFTAAAACATTQQEVTATSYGDEEQAALKGTDAPSGMSNANASALAWALVVMLVVPWTLCFLAYSILHCTYRRDKDMAGTSVARSRTSANGKSDHNASTVECDRGLAGNHSSSDGAGVLAPTVTSDAGSFATTELTELPQ